MNICLSKGSGMSHLSLPVRRQYLPPKPLLFLLIFFLPFLTKAQDVAVTGSVTDSSTKILAGVTVSTDESKRNVLTDDQGFFSIKVSPKDKNLVFSYVGMKNITQPLNGSSNYEITMTPDASGLK